MDPFVVVSQPWRARWGLGAGVGTPEQDISRNIFLAGNRVAGSDPWIARGEDGDHVGGSTLAAARHVEYRAFICGVPGEDSADRRRLR